MNEKTSKKTNTLSYALIIIGLLLILIPQVSAAGSIAVEMLLGWVLTIGAAGQIALLVMNKVKSDFFIWVIAIALLVVGLYFLINPLSAAALMTWLFAGLTFVSGIAAVIQSFSQQGNGKKMLIANGLLGIAFALMIWFSWPLSGMTFIGVLLGVHLLISGMARLMYGK